MKICCIASDIPILGKFGGPVHAIEVAQNLVELGDDV